MMRLEISSRKVKKVQIFTLFLVIIVSFSFVFFPSSLYLFMVIGQELTGTRDLAINDDPDKGGEVIRLIEKVHHFNPDSRIGKVPGYPASVYGTGRLKHGILSYLTHDKFAIYTVLDLNEQNTIINAVRAFAQTNKLPEIELDFYDGESPPGNCGPDYPGNLLRQVYIR